MIIDEKRTSVLTKYRKLSKSESDHNILYAKFAVSYFRAAIKTKREIFNFKNKECQRMFFDVTDNSTKLSSCFQSTKDFQGQSKSFFKNLNRTFYQCLKKIRITNKSKKENQLTDDFQKCLDMKANLKTFSTMAKSEFAKYTIKMKIEQIEEKILKITSEKNAKKITEQISQIQTLDGSFSQTGMWNVRSKLFPRLIDPPMAKKDIDGNLITGPEALKKLYSQTYADRLKPRQIKADFQEIFDLKSILWDQRMKIIKSKKSNPWTLSDVEKITKSLKNNQTRDPNGMINELLKPNIMGKDLKFSILQLMNGIKHNLFFPDYMQLANISSIYKNNRKSRFDIESERGIFILPVLRKLLDKLIYEDKYPSVDQNMSDSNIGARRGKNIKNHLFIIYGIINSVLVEGKSCIDIQIYDLIKAFDRLWLEDCMNDLYDSIPSEQLDDKLALIYQANTKNQVAVNTAVGLTKRVNIENIVTQGGVFGSLQCSNSIDTIGKKCYNYGEHLYSYKQIVNIMPLSMVDDILAVAPCNQKSLALNTVINAQIELKKLKFHTPDKNGKSKCHVMHVGKPNDLCPTLQVHGTDMSHVTEDTYLGDVILCDGKNT